MLVILDTNVLLSALRAERSPPAAILDAWRTGRFSLVTSAEQIDEFKRAAGYAQLRPYLSRRAIGQVVNELRAAELLLERLRRSGDSPDPGNDYLLAMAAASGADVLVTGDKALLALKGLGVTKIVSPRRFATMLGH